MKDAAGLYYWGQATARTQHTRPREGHPDDVREQLIEGYRGQWEGPGVAEQILSVRAKAAARGIGAGVMCTSIEDGARRREVESDGAARSGPCGFATARSR